MSTIRSQKNKWRSLKHENESLIKFFISLGFSVLSFAKRNENGPDVWIVKNGKPYTVEIKKCRKTGWDSIQVPPVESNRRNDDFILVQHPSGYILFEPMRDHLNNCTAKGYRTLWT